jgi:hypothetical protein
LTPGRAGARAAAPLVAERLLLERWTAEGGPGDVAASLG